MLPRYGGPRNPSLSRRRRLIEWIAVVLAVVTVIGISTMTAVWRSPSEVVVASASIQP